MADTRKSSRRPQFAYGGPASTNRLWVGDGVAAGPNLVQSGHPKGLG